MLGCSPTRGSKAATPTTCQHDEVVEREDATEIWRCVLFFGGGSHVPLPFFTSAGWRSSGKSLMLCLSNQMSSVLLTQDSQIMCMILLSSVWFNKMYSL
jgi:hypothetical protein